MRLEELVKGKTYRVDAGSWGGLYGHVALTPSGSAAVMVPTNDPNLPNVKVWPGWIVREASEADLEALRVESSKIDAGDVKGKESELAQEERRSRDAAIIAHRSDLLVAKIQAATTTVMYFTSLQTKNDTEIELCDEDHDLVDSARRFLKMMFDEEDELP